MTNKDEANTPQRLRMEQRWAKAREECPAGTCVPASRFHVQGCTRRDNRKVTLAPEAGQKTKVTNLVTGETREVTILPSDGNAMKNVLKEQGGQATRLEPACKDFPEEYWDVTEARFLTIPVPRTEDVRALTLEEEEMRTSLLAKLEQALMPAPARPWWKFWGRRG